MSRNPRPTVSKNKKDNDNIFVLMFTDIILALILVMFYTFSPGKHNSDKQIPYTDVTKDQAQESSNDTERRLNTSIIYIKQRGFKLSGKEYTSIKMVLKTLKEKGISRVIVVPKDKREQQLFRALIKDNFDLAVGYVK